MVLSRYCLDTNVVLPRYCFRIGSVFLVLAVSLHYRGIIAILSILASIIIALSLHCYYLLFSIVFTRPLRAHYVIANIS